MADKVTGAPSTARDITQREQATEALRRRNEELTAINAVAEAVNRSVDLRDMLGAALETARAAVGADGGLIYLFDEARGQFVPTIHSGLSDGVIGEVNGFRMGQGLSGAVAASGRPLVLDDLTADPRDLSPAAAREGWRSYAAVPIAWGSKTLGVMVLLSLEARQFAPDHTDLLSHIARHVSTAIEKARFYQEARRELAERERAEKRLRLVSSVVEQSAEGIAVVDLEGNVLFANASLAAMHGLVPAQVVGKHLSAFHKPEQIPAVGEMIRQVQGKGEFRRDLRHVRADGTVSWSFMRCSCLRDEAGKATGLIVSFRDISDRKRTEADLEAVNRALRVLSECNKAVARATEEAELLREVCRIIVETGGYRFAWIGFAEHDEGKTVRPVAHAGHEEGYLETMKITWADAERGRGPTGRGIRTGKPCVVKDTQTDPGYGPWRVEAGRRGYVSTIALPLLASGEPFGTINIYSARPDVFDDEEVTLLTDLADSVAYGIVALRTDAERPRAEAQRRELEEQFRQAQKMEAVGRLAGGIAHDFNNKLAVVLAYCEIALRDLAPQDPLRQPLEEILRATRAAADLTNQLLLFSRKRAPRPEVVDLSAVLRQMQCSLRRIVEENIQLQVALAPQPASVLIDPTHLEQVVMNLAVNARDAMPQGGKLTFETSIVDCRSRSAEWQPEPACERCVMLTVSDTGCGMDAETLERVFEPFFTTKEIGKGTGLGLATVYGIVEQAGGTVRVASEPGRGTTFRVYLPLVVGTPAASPAPAELREPLPRGSETILVVEDEEPLRQVILLSLNECGYKTLQAGNAREALPLAEHYEGQIDLLLTDVVMPGMNGPELARRVRVVRPGVKVLYVSGYAAEAMAACGMADDETLLRKPFTPSRLAQTVRRLLDRAETGG